MGKRFANRIPALGGRRLAAGLLLTAFLLVMLFSAVFPAAEAGHDCTGDGCAVCAVIQQCQTLLRQTGNLYTPALMGPVALLLTGAVCITLLTEAVSATLVSRKVRLDN